jgi:hypothetical protein
MTRPWHQNVRRSPAYERTLDGVVFDSKAELARWRELKLMQSAGEISGLTRQREFILAFNGRPVLMRSARYPNGRVCKYTADFSYTTAKGVVTVEEHKGHDLPESRLRRAVCEALYGIEIIVTGPAASKTPRKKAAA